MKALVAKGDPTTTGGRVLGGSSTQYDDRVRPLSLDGDLATCGKCDGGPFRICGRADTWLEDGRYMAQHMDLVLCPCGGNRVIAGQDAYLMIEGGGRSKAPVTTNLNAVQTVSNYDECVVLYSQRTGEPLSDVSYRFVQGSSVVLEGRTDALGRTRRIDAALPETYQIQVKGV